MSKSKFSLKSIILSLIWILPILSITTPTCVSVVHANETSQVTRTVNETNLSSPPIGPVQETEDITITRDLNKNPLTEDEKELVKYLNTLALSQEISLFASSNFGSRVQNGGVNFFYDSASGKKTLIDVFNQIIAGCIAGKAITTIVSSIAIAAGASTLPAAVTKALVKFGLNWVKSNANLMKSKVQDHGNKGTVRATLTEVVWSSTYDKKW